MYWIHAIIVSVVLQALIITGINGNVIPRRRRQQTSGSLYGNQNLAGNVPAAYNYGSNTNVYGTNLNNQGTKDLYGNPVVPSNTGNTMNNVGPNNQQQQQQQQLQQQQQQQNLYGVNSQSLSNPSYGGANLYPGSATNQLGRDHNVNMGMRDSNGNLIPTGSAGSSLFSASNPQLSYPANTNQVLPNKDMYNVPTNTNNNPYGYNSNSYPNSNTYSGQMAPINDNNNNNNNVWPNNQYNSNAGNTWNVNRDLSTNKNNNNNNNQPYSNPNSPYFYNSHGRQIMASCLILLCSFLAISFFHI